MSNIEVPVNPLTIRVTYQPPGRVLPKQLEVAAAYVPSPDSSSSVDTLVLGGLGLEGSLTNRAARIAAQQEGVSGAMVVERLPYHIPSSDPESLEDFTSQVFGKIFKYAQQELGAHQVNAIGESQGAAALMEFVRRNPEAVKGGIAFLRGLGSTTGMTAPKLLGGIAKSGAQRDSFTNPAVLRVGWNATKDFLRSVKGDNGTLRYVLGYSLIPGLQEITASKEDVYVVAAERDKLLPKEDQAQALGAAGLGDKLYTIEGSHATLAGKAGAHQLAWTIDHIKTGGKTLPPYSPQK